MKKVILSMLAVAALTFTSCTSDDDDNNGGSNENGQLAGAITSNLTLDASVEYTLTGAVFVKDGVTLTIPAGTTIKALAGGTDVYLLVEKGGKIIADGDASNPITFTSNAASPAAGDWGGVIINGKAPVSRPLGQASNSATEVNSGIFYGGDVNNDNSGILDYVILEYTGARIDGDAEHNGLTLNGVGNGTVLSNIAILYGDDDAIEFFGGSVNASNILAVNAKDDMFDFTQGYTGTCTNLYGIREAGFTAVTSDPRGIEADGNLDGNSPTDIDQSVFTVNGLTIEHNGEVEMSDAIKVRRGATATITNAIVKSGNAQAIFGDIVDLQDSKSDATDNTTVTLVIDPANGVDVSDLKNTVSAGATINATSGTTGGADFSVFSWTGYTK